MNASKSDQEKLQEILGRLKLSESPPSSPRNSSTNINAINPQGLQSDFNRNGQRQSVSQQKDAANLGHSSLNNGVHVPKYPSDGLGSNQNGLPKNAPKSHAKTQHAKSNGWKAKERSPVEVQKLPENNIKVKVEEEVDNTPENGNVDSSLAALFLKYQTERDAEAQLQAQEIAKVKQEEAAAATQEFSRKGVPRKILEQMRKLPIYSSKKELIDLLQKNQMLVVIGETGSGKSTQIPQYLVEAGYAVDGKIGITQPRRVAAKALAERVAIECGVKLGTSVGYAVRFDKCVSGSTIIKYMTDGMLVKEFSQEASLNGYSVIIIDEAHERSIHTDICFGLLKRAALSRPDLKIIISSATLDSQKFSKYFNDAPVLKVHGKGYGVELLYEPYPCGDYIQRSVDTIFRIHSNEPRSDVLVFLSGQDEIDQVWDLLEAGSTLRGISPSELVILPCCGSLPFEEQQKIFEETPVGCRKIVLATNIAETSITIDGIVYVIDCGHFKQNQYNPRSGIDSLLKMKITKFQAIQRAGRAGRTRAGKCYRLYTENEYSAFKQAAIPEIQRGNVESVVLDLISMEISDITKFDFMDSPSTDALMRALESLQWLSALDSHLGITHLGIRMSKFPLDPPLAKVLMESARLGCSAEVLTIVSLLSTQFQKLFNRTKKKRTLADAKKAAFNDSDGDHFTLLKVYTEWERNHYREDWCRQNFVAFRHLLEAFEVRQELRDVLLSHGLLEVSCGSRKECVQKAFAPGYFRRVARKKLVGHAYDTLPLTSFLSSEDVFLHPSSTLFHVKPHPQWIIFHEVKKTSKAYISGAIVIKHEWIKEYAPDFAKRLEATYGITF